MILSIAKGHAASAPLLSPESFRNRRRACRVRAGASLFDTTIITSHVKLSAWPGQESSFSWPAAFLCSAAPCLFALEILV